MSGFCGAFYHKIYQHFTLVTQWGFADKMFLIVFCCHFITQLILTNMIQNWFFCWHSKRSKAQMSQLPFVSKLCNWKHFNLSIFRASVSSAATILNYNWLKNVVCPVLMCQTCELHELDEINHATCQSIVNTLTLDRPRNQAKTTAVCALQNIYASLVWH